MLVSVFSQALYSCRQVVEDEGKVIFESVLGSIGDGEHTEQTADRAGAIHTINLRTAIGLWGDT
jgi:hypothetical protein